MLILAASRLLHSTGCVKFEDLHVQLWPTSQRIRYEMEIERMVEDIPGVHTAPRLPTTS